MILSDVNEKDKKIKFLRGQCVKGRSMANRYLKVPEKPMNK